MKAKDIVFGVSRFGRLYPVGETSDGKIICHCKRPREEHPHATVAVTRGNLLSGNSQSCGCRKAEIASKTMGGSGNPDRDREQVRALRAQGFTFTEIGRQVGLSRQRVHVIYRSIAAEEKGKKRRADGNGRA